MAKVNQYDLLSAYAWSRSDKARAELKRREMFTDEEWELIDARKVRIGMRDIAVIASWGKPRGNNSTVTASGKRDQWVYGNEYVYFENRVVTAMQQHR